MKKYEYVASISPRFEIFAPIAKDSGLWDKVCGLVDDAVSGVVEAPGVAESLKVRSKDKEIHQMRGITMRPHANGPALIDCYVKWNWDLDKWHVLVELPDEGFFDQQRVYKQCDLN